MKTKLRKTYNLIIRIFIVVVTLGFLYNEVFRKKDLEGIINFYPEVSSGEGFVFIVVFVFLLLIVNYLLEAVKWRFFMAPLEKITLLDSLKAVLTGVSVSMFMPNRVGDYLGRVFILKTADRLQAVISTIVGSMSQLITTFLFGSTALLIAFPQYVDLSEQLNKWAYAGLWVVVLLGNFTIVFAYLSFGAFSAVIKKISGKGYKKIQKYADVFSLYKWTDMLFVLAISMLRYLVFSLQFFLLLLLFKVEIDYFNSMVLISLVYLAMVIIPTVALTEIGVRGSVSVYFFEFYFNSIGSTASNQALGVASASTALWLFNLVIPAFIGAIFVFSLKFFRKGTANGRVD